MNAAIISFDINVQRTMYTYIYTQYSTHYLHNAYIVSVSALHTHATLVGSG